jgi:hypothetical protein
MNRLTNPILMIMPVELFGLLIVGMLVCGGLAMTVGARKLGRRLMIGAIALPFIMLLVEALIDDLFVLMPDFMIMPVAFLITVLAWLMLAWALLRLAVGQAALENARGALLADCIKAMARPLFSHPFILIGGLFVAYLLWSPA